MQSKKSIFFSLMCLGLAVLMGCEKKFSNPVAVSPKTYPSSPSNLSAKIGDKTVYLSWFESSIQRITQYKIFRRDSLMKQCVLYDSTSNTHYMDNDVRNGMLYAYCVSAINSNGYEGQLSDEIYTTPGVYSITINRGATYTNSKDVTLTLIGLAGTQFMEICNDSLFNNSSWESFETEKNWELSEGDGIKKVYCRFRDEEDNFTHSHIVDTIVLDTQAKIYSLNENSDDSWNTTGDTLKFILVTDEPFGKATIDIGSQLQGIQLYDDATNGDVTLNDGTYTLNFIITPDIEINEAPLIGNFQDHLGNVSEPFVSQTTITIQNPPKAVQLFKPESIGSSSNSLYLYWSTNSDVDFLNYKVYRGMTSRVDTSSALIKIISDQTATTMIDNNLQGNTSYFYRVYVFDNQGFSSSSNIMKGTTGANLPPEPVNLLEPVADAEHSLSLSWTQSNENDFAFYRLFRSKNADINNEINPIFTADNPNEIFYLDYGLESSTTYYYCIFVYDTYGQSTGSNLVSAVTLENSLPEPVILANPSPINPLALRLTWSMNNDSDFNSYRIHRSTTEEIDQTSVPIEIINNQATTSYNDVGLMSNTQYFYKVYVCDEEGACSGSNIATNYTLP